MRIVSRAGKAVKARESWHNTYYDSRFGWRFGEEKRVKYEALVALGQEPNPDDVDRVIGNPSWTSCRCDECDSTPEFLVMVGQEPDYDANTVHLCAGCITKLGEMI